LRIAHGRELQVIPDDVGPVGPKLVGPKVIARGGKASAQYPGDPE